MVLLYKNRISFLFKLLFFGLSINYFMVYFFKEVVKHNIKQLEIQITVELTIYAMFHLLVFKYA